MLVARVAAAAVGMLNARAGEERGAAGSPGADGRWAFEGAGGRAGSPRGWGCAGAGRRGCVDSSLLLGAVYSDWEADLIDRHPMPLTAGWLAAGDSAMSIDPLSGQDLYRALEADQAFLDVDFTKCEEMRLAQFRSEPTAWVRRSGWGSGRTRSPADPIVRPSAWIPRSRRRRP